MADNYPYQAAAANSVATLDEFPSYDYDIDSLTDDPHTTTAVNNPFSPQTSPRDIFSNAKFFDFDLNSDIGAAMGSQHNLNFGPGEFAMNAPIDANLFNMMPSPNFNSSVLNEDNSNNSASNTSSRTPAGSEDNHTNSNSPTSNTSRSRKRTTSTASVDPAKKRSKSDTTAQQPLADLDLDESSKISAEEDKRRRNTAASARFRIKKKERERATEVKARELEERLAHVEGKYRELEKENSLLKGLLTEKNSAAHRKWQDGVKAEGL